MGTTFLIHHAVPFCLGCISVLVSHWLGFAHGWRKGHLAGWNEAALRTLDPSYIEYFKANGFEIKEDAPCSP